ncbi:hypothetical protein CKA32_000678 [Geitlerinema sp. FC II]|nr:hypothetical protein CKA32_000678 [Geitlerinema sp. FC II]
MGFSTFGGERHDFDDEFQSLEGIFGFFNNQSLSGADTELGFNP